MLGALVALGFVAALLPTSASAATLCKKAKKDKFKVLCTCGGKFPTPVYEFPEGPDADVAALTDRIAALEAQMGAVEQDFSELLEDMLASGASRSTPASATEARRSSSRRAHRSRDPRPG